MRFATTGNPTVLATTPWVFVGMDVDAVGAGIGSM